MDSVVSEVVVTATNTAVYEREINWSAGSSVVPVRTSR